MLDFFVHGIVPVQEEETLEIIIETAMKTREQTDEWFEIRLFGLAGACADFMSILSALKHA